MWKIHSVRQTVKEWLIFLVWGLLDYLVVFPLLLAYDQIHLAGIALVLPVFSVLHQLWLVFLALRGLDPSNI